MSHLDNGTRLVPCSYLHYVQCDTEIISCVPKKKIASCCSHQRDKQSATSFCWWTCFVTMATNLPWKIPSSRVLTLMLVCPSLSCAYTVTRWSAITPCRCDAWVQTPCKSNPGAFLWLACLTPSISLAYLIVGSAQSNQLELFCPFYIATELNDEAFEFKVS